MHYEHLVHWIFQSKNQAFPFTEAIICVVNLLMLQLRILFVANIEFTRLFCRKCRDYALFRVEFYAEFLEEILRNTQNFGRNSAEKIGHWSL